MVVVKGKEEVHEEGSYYLLDAGQWIKAGETAVEAQAEQKKRLARQHYERATGEVLPSAENKGELLADAIAGYLGELEMRVAGKSRKPKTFKGARLALGEFAGESGVKHLKDVTASHISKHMAWVVENSRTHSGRTAFNKFMAILQFLKYVGHVPVVGAGRNAHALGLKDAPKYTEKKVETYDNADLAKFFAACDPRKLTIFQTFNRAGLREEELCSTRRCDLNLGNGTPTISVVERPEYNFTPKVSN